MDPVPKTSGCEICERWRRTRAGPAGGWSRHGPPFTRFGRTGYSASRSSSTASIPWRAVQPKNQRKQRQGWSPTQRMVPRISFAVRSPTRSMRARAIGRQVGRRQYRHLRLGRDAGERSTGSIRSTSSPGGRLRPALPLVRRPQRSGAFRRQRTAVTSAMIAQRITISSRPSRCGAGRNEQVAAEARRRAAEQRRRRRPTYLAPCSAVRLDVVRRWRRRHASGWWRCAIPRGSLLCRARRPRHQVSGLPARRTARSGGAELVDQVDGEDEDRPKTEGKDDRPTTRNGNSHRFRLG